MDSRIRGNDSKAVCGVAAHNGRIQSRKDKLFNIH